MPPERRRGASDRTATAPQPSRRAQLYQMLRLEILDGRMGPGALLPSTRELSASLGVSRNTALAAVGQLLSEGYLVARRGSGTRVAPVLPDAPPPREPDPAAAPARPRLSRFGRRIVEGRLGNPYAAMLGYRPLPFDFIYGIPPVHELPHELWRRLVARRARRRPLLSFMYGPSEGVPALREAIAGHLGRIRGIACTADEVIVVSGFQQAADLVARLLLDPGDRVVVEEAHYVGARLAFQAAGARLHGVPLDGAGMRTDRLPRARTKLAYVTPSHQFPTGATLDLPRRLELLRWADARGACILEDDYDTEYRYSGRPLPALRGIDRAGRVLYAGTFSKVLFPALRLGYLVSPPALLPAFRGARFLAGWGTGAFEQEVLAEFMAEGHYESHLRSARRRNAERHEALVGALAEHLGDRVEVCGTGAGLHVLAWLRDLREPLDALIARARRTGVGIYPVAPYYLRPPRRPGILLGYGAMGPPDIREGVARLAKILIRH